MQKNILTRMYIITLTIGEKLSSAILLPRAWVQSLVKELITHKPWGGAKR